MFLVLLKFSLLMVYAIANEFIGEYKHPEIMPENEHSFLPTENEKLIETNNIENTIVRIENIALSAEKSRREGILPVEHTENLYDEMVETLEEITELLKEPRNTYRFLNSKGVDRIITPIIGINHELLKKQMLILIKTLFYIAPTSTNALIPISVVDKLLDIFEHDDNLALKAHALDIMYVWLPENPEIQARVMKLKGLEPFYNQIAKLDTTGTYTLLNLFNNILAEHLKARDETSQKNKEDFEKMKLYQMIGLIERMSTPHVCNGILNILETILSFKNEDNEIPINIFDLLKNIQPFCQNIFKGKGQALKVFSELKSYVAEADSNKAKMPYNLAHNRTDIKVMLDDFVKNVKDNRRDEF